MDYDFYRVLDNLSGTILIFDLNNFTSKDNIPPKTQYVLASAFS